MWWNRAPQLMVSGGKRERGERERKEEEVSEIPW